MTFDGVAREGGGREEARGVRDVVPQAEAPVFDPEPRMSFSKNHAAEKSKGVTQLLRVESKELQVHRILL